jgi:hypothetical protein
MILPELSNTESLILELVIGISIAIGISLYFDWKQRSILDKIQRLEEKQSDLINTMESRRRERIRWFKRISLTLLNSVKKRYQMLSEAVDKYVEDPSEENERKIKSIASTSLQITVRSAYDVIVQREIPNAKDYIENPWIIAKLADVLSLIGDGFGTAKNSPTDITNIKESIKLSVDGLDSAIEQITNERDSTPTE